MMKVVFLADTVAAFQDVVAGQVMELPYEEAKYLMAIGKASDKLPEAKPARKAKTDGAE